MRRLIQPSQRGLIRSLGGEGGIGVLRCRRDLIPMGDKRGIGNGGVGNRGGVFGEVVVDTRREGIGSRLEKIVEESMFRLHYCMKW